MKTCTKCKQTKQTTDFPKDKARTDGLNSQCKQCRRKYIKNESDDGLPKITNGEYFISEYQFLRSQGIEHSRIATMLGVKVAAVHRRSTRLGVRSFEPGERVALDFIRRMCDQGTTFTSVDLPYSVAGEQATAAIAYAVRSGWIVKSGVKSHPLSLDGGSVRVYSPVEVADVLAG